MNAVKINLKKLFATENIEISYNFEKKSKNTLTSPPFLHLGNGSGIQQFCLHQKQLKDKDHL